VPLRGIAEGCFRPISTRRTRLHSNKTLRGTPGRGRWWQLEDHSFPASKFEKVAGDSTAAWDTIGANANITHKFTVKAKAPGTYGVGSAMITCAASPCLEL
jgi:hypothetical protein